MSYIESTRIFAVRGRSLPACLVPSCIRTTTCVGVSAVRSDEHPGLPLIDSNLCVRSFRMTRPRDPHGAPRGPGTCECITAGSPHGIGAAHAPGGRTCPLFYAYVVASEHIHSNTKFRSESSAARTTQSCTHVHPFFGHCSGESAVEHCTELGAHR